MSLVLGGEELLFLCMEKSAPAHETHMSAPVTCSVKTTQQLQPAFSKCFYKQNESVSLKGSQSEKKHKRDTSNNHWGTAVVR